MRKKTMPRAILILFVLTLLTTPALQAQPSASDAIQSLKNGALVMRLPTYAKKIAALEDIIARNSDEASVRRARTLLEQTVTETKEENLRIIRSFREFYNFSAVYFMYDTSLTALAKGARKGIFLQDDLSPNPALSLQSDQFIIAQIGYTDPATTARAEALILTDLSLKRIEAPFPSAIRYNTLSELFGLKDTAREKQIKLLNKRLKQIEVRAPRE